MDVCLSKTPPRCPIRYCEQCYDGGYHEETDKCSYCKFDLCDFHGDEELIIEHQCSVCHQGNGEACIQCKDKVPGLNECESCIMYIT